VRLDQALVAQGLARSRTQARGLIEAGQVLVDGVPATKASQNLADGCLSLTEDIVPWVSRGAQKLLHALDHFGLSPDGAVAADIGASTGGFTQVLVSRGAARVHAVDAGHDQLVPELRQDPRVVLHERMNARTMAPDLLPPLDWVVCDVSFISATKALPSALDRARPGATLVCLVKPQFEVGPQRVGKGGIVNDAAAREEACQTVVTFLEATEWSILGLIPSPITGGDGNVEFLLAARKAGG